MKDTETKKKKALCRLSRLAMLAAALLLLNTCRVCGLLARPEQRIKAAFSALSEALYEGQNAVQAFAESCQVLLDARMD